MNKRLLLIVTLLISLIPMTQTVSAHVLNTDSTGEFGVILHINPDDDPIAGEPSMLFFDIQSDTFSQHAHDLNLRIVNNQSVVTEVPIETAGSSVSANYTFPTQGTYEIILTAPANSSSNGTMHTFTHTQRVSRGVTGSIDDKPKHTWAEVLLLISLCTLFVLIIVAFNRRQQIKLASKW